MPRINLRTMAKNADGQRGARSQAASRSNHSRSFKERSAGEFHGGGHRPGLRQQVETALFQKGGRRLLRVARAMGRDASSVASLPCEGRLVGTLVPAGEFQTPHERAL